MIPLHVPRVAAVSDLSGFGRCSLTVAIPVLSAMGMQVCPVPTAVLSNHTGYPAYSFEPCPQEPRRFTDNWRKLELTFDAVFTGFLANAAQGDDVLGLMTAFKQEKTVVLVDPVLADNGKLYATCGGDLTEQMKRLVAQATVTTPNLTEACLLTDTPYAEWENAADPAAFVAKLAERLQKLGARQVVITGVQSAKAEIANAVLDENGNFSLEASPLIPSPFAGTGDLFASVTCGALVQGKPLREAVGIATKFVHRVAKVTYDCQQPVQDGMMFEPFLSELPHK